MIIKYPELIHHLQKNLAPLYIVIGTDTYMLEESIQKIKATWLKKEICDEKYFQIQQTYEWTDCFQEANHYSLFAPHTLLKIRFDKKNIDSNGLACMKAYLENPNLCCLVLIEAPNISAKQLQFIAKHSQAVLVQASTLSPPAFQAWIKRMLDEKGLRFEPSIPNLIHQYNQNNMLAVIQIIETLSMRVGSEQFITASLLSEYLTDQCEYPLFDLAEACLNTDMNKALHLLRCLNQSKNEPSLVLWLITQEIRLLLQWHQLMKQAIPFEVACKQLNIWPQRGKTYSMAIKRIGLLQLSQLLIQCHDIDILIKSAKTNEIWHALENLTVNLTKTGIPA